LLSRSPEWPIDTYARPHEAAACGSLESGPQTVAGGVFAVSLFRLPSAHFSGQALSPADAVNYFLNSLKLDVLGSLSPQDVAKLKVLACT
jgi:hypothetical protein